jgi:hypothetical protein
MEGKETENNDGLDIEFSIDAIEDVETGKENPTPEAEVEAPAEEPIAKEAKEEPIEDIETKDPLQVKPIEAAEQEEPEEASVVSEIISKLGYDIEGDFEDSPEGIVELTKVASEKMAEETLESIFNAHPTVKQHLDFVMAGGDPNRFMATQGETTYASMEIKGSDVETQKEILKSYFKARGDEDAFIDDMIETYEDKDQLYDKAVAAKNALAKAQDARKQQLLEVQRAEAQRKQQEAEQTWNTVKETVTKASDLAGIPISERDRSKFIDYISKPVTREGYTQRDLDAGKLSLEQHLAMDFFLYKGKDMSKILDTKAKTAAAQSLKERLKSASGKMKGGKSDPNIKGGQRSQAIEDISVDGLF